MVVPENVTLDVVAVLVEALVAPVTATPIAYVTVDPPLTDHVL